MRTSPLATQIRSVYEKSVSQSASRQPGITRGACPSLSCAPARTNAETTSDTGFVIALSCVIVTRAVWRLDLRQCVDAGSPCVYDTPKRRRPRSLGAGDSEG